MYAKIEHFLTVMWTWLQFVWPDRRWTTNIVLNGRTFVVTGGNTGIGLETVRDLVGRGARVIVGCRDTTKGEEAVKDLVEKGGDVVIKKLDLASFASIRQFAREVLFHEQHIHVLINNAGLGSCPYWKTEDGFEMQFGVNHLGHFLLTLLLLDRLKESAPSRIVSVSSSAHYIGEIDFDDINYERNYDPLKAYYRSKLANVLFTRELAKKLKGTGVTTYCLHPGAVRTGLGRHLEQTMGSCSDWLFRVVGRLFFKNVKEGARTTLYCALEESLIDESGYYYSGCRKMVPSSKARDDRAAEKLWEVSEQLTQAQIS